jgi:hypothetical protein
VEGDMTMNAPTILLAGLAPIRVDGMAEHNGFL